jgi:HEAT repeat protein
MSISAIGQTRRAMRMNKTMIPLFTFTIISFCVQAFADPLQNLVDDLKSPDPDLRVEAARQLGELKDPAAVEALIEALRDPWPSVQIAAIKALTISKPPSAVEPLVKALSDSHANVREYAGEALKQFDDQKVIETLKVAASNGNDLAFKMLSEFADPPSSESIKILLRTRLIEEAGRTKDLLRSTETKRKLADLYGFNNLDSSHKDIAGEVILAISSPEVVRHYGELRLDYRVSSKGHRYTALGLAESHRYTATNEARVHPESLYLERETVTIVITDKRKKIVSHRTYSGGEPKQVEEFDGSYKKHSESVDLDQIYTDLLTNIESKGLEEIGKSDGLLGRTARAVWMARFSLESDAERALNKRKAPLVSSSAPNIPDDLKRKIDDLIVGLASSDAAVRRKAGYSIQEITDERAIDPLLEAFKGGNGHARRSIVVALGHIKSSKSMEPLIDALNDNDAEVRRQAAWALGKIGDTEALKPLAGRLKDVNISVREEVERAINLIKFGK